MVGPVLVTLPMVRLGQRVTLMMGLFLALISWLMLALAPTVWFLLFARFLQGVATSVVRIPLMPYVTELAHSTVRGQLCCSISFFYQCGFLLTFAVASSDLSWRQVALTCGIVTTVPSFIGLYCLPDSPRWLATRGRTEEACKSLTFFRGPHYNSNRELASITEQLERSFANQLTVLEQIREIRKPSILPYFIVMAVANFLLPLDGYIVLPSYVVIIINDANIHISSYLCAVIVGVMGVIGSFIFTLIVDRFNRRELLTVSALITSVAIALVGVYFYDKSHSRYFEGKEWFPIVFLAIFSTSSLNPVLTLLRSEIFPNAVRSTVVPIIFTLVFLGGFLALEGFPYLVESLGDSGVFWLFSGINMFYTSILLFTVPETRGKSLEQITDIQQTSRDQHLNANV